MPSNNETSDSQFQLHLSPAYDLLQSLYILANPAKRGRWQKWAEEVTGTWSETQWQTLRRWFGGDYPPGSGFLVVIALLPGSPTIEAFLAALAQLPIADFLRIIVTIGPTNPETPLDTPSLLALQTHPEQARAFIDTYLGFTGQQRQHILTMLAHPENARLELLSLLQDYHEQVYPSLEQQIRDEGVESANRLQPLLDAHPASLPTWLDKGFNVQGFNPIILVPSVLHASETKSYFHETRHSLFDDRVFEPLILMIGTQKILKYTTQAESVEDTASSPTDEPGQWATLFSALADPSRMHLIHLLAQRPYYQQELATACNISGATVSHHVGLLIRAGLVRIERQGHRTYVVLQTNTLAQRLQESQRYMLDTAKEINHE